MRICDSKNELLYIPIKNIFGLNSDEENIIKSVQSHTWKRTMKCFSHVRDSYYACDSINPYHMGQYCLYLYFLANTIHVTFDKNDDVQKLCEKIFMTNLTISGADIYYAHCMPDIFLPIHPNGIVLTGRAKIGNYFLAMQGCTVGENGDFAPTIGEGVIMMSNSKIVGNCHIGDRVVLCANTYVKDTDIPSNSLVFGQYPNLIIKENRKDEVESLLAERFYVG
ncbi:MAG: transferase [Lachnospiraceae bacterium]|nr:transferase [Lachnospiraceae bacterium]